MSRRNVLLTTLVLVALLLPGIPAGAVAIREAAGHVGPALTPPFDPQQVVSRARNRFQEMPGGFTSDNGRRRVAVNDWGVTLTPYLNDEVRPAYRLGFRLVEVRAGDEVVFAAPPQGGVAPVLRDEATAAYTRAAGLREEYRAMDYAVEQVYVLLTPPPGQGDLVLAGQLSTTLVPERDGGGLRFPLGGGIELTYGGALARDAGGRELPLEVGWDGGRVELRVPAEWLAGATYPLEIDPLIGTNLVVSSAAQDQVAPAVAADPVNGRYLVVWEDYRNGAGNADIYGQLVNADGSFQGTYFRIYDDSGHHQQKAPAVAFDATSASKNYLVVWQDSQSGTSYDIYSVLVSPSGVVGTARDIATDVNDQVAPAVAVDLEAGHDTTRFLVAWTDYSTDSVFGDVRGRLVSASGAPGNSIDVAVAAGRVERTPAAAYSSRSHCWLLAWEDRPSAAPDQNVYGRQFSYDGLPSGPALAISGASGDQGAPTVAYNQLDDQYLVAWEDARGGMLTGWDIYGQRVNGDGSLDPQGNLAVNNSPGDQRYPAAAYGSTNDYLVAWQEGTAAVKSQQVSNRGALTVGLYTLSTCGPLDVCERPAVALNGLHNLYLVVWQYKNAMGGTYDIKGQRLDHSFIVTTDSESYPDVAYDPDDDRYLVVWMRAVGGNTYVYGHLVAPTGALLGSPILICGSNDCTGSRKLPDVAYSPDWDRYLVVWEDHRGSDTDIYGREVSADGTPRGSASFEICGPVRCAGTNAQERPALAYDRGVSGVQGDDQYLAVWADYRSTTNWDVDGARVVPAVGYPPAVNQLAAAISAQGYDEDYARVAANPGDSARRFLAVWENRTGNIIYGQFVSAAGGNTGGPLTIMASAVKPAVAYEGSLGRHLVTGRVSIGLGLHHYGQLLDASGTPDGSAFQVSHVGGNEEVGADIAAFGGHFRVLWRGGNVGASAGSILGRDVETLSPLTLSDGYIVFGRYPSGNSDTYPTLACRATLHCLAARWISGDDVYVGLVFH